MEIQCKKCGEWVEGEDLGDHPFFLTFCCECGNYWGENCVDDFTDMAMNIDGGF
jgi:hypothetical protein